MDNYKETNDEKILQQNFMLEERDRKTQNRKTLLGLPLAVLFSLFAVILLITFVSNRINKKLERDYFQIARKELNEEKKREIIDAAKQLLLDSDLFLIDLQNENLQSITESDLDYLRSTRDIVLDIESCIAVPPFLDNDIDVLIIHVTKAIGNDDYTFTTKDLETLKRISRILSENEATIQMGDGRAPLHLLEYKVASRIN